MRRERSQQRGPSKLDGSHREQPQGALFLVGVPIGHPDDITIRALSILRRVDIVATEDPLSTQVLFRHHNLHPTLTSYGPTKIQDKVEILINRLQQGASVALLSDCGSPVISDPGSLLVTAAQRNNIPVFSLPGPSAVTAAVAASGFPAEAFHFYGDLPTSADSLKRRLMDILRHAEPTILFCSTECCSAILCAITKVAPRREVALACDLTLEQETTFRGTARYVAERLKEIRPPQQITMIVAGENARGRKAGHRSKTSRSPRV